ncbi:hypothetical protein [Stutzerimonas xanthomarina]|uniref:hypothetical protein n=1 Tax=Stutzerimonas xanthomarina TaxID=271420 RepID=UPI003AA8FE2A
MYEPYKRRKAHRRKRPLRQKPHMIAEWGTTGLQVRSSEQSRELIYRDTQRI